MPSILLRHSGISNTLTEAVESIGEVFDRRWSPGDRRTKSTTREDFGFNICLVDKEESPVAECIQEAVHRMDDLAEKLAPLGHSLQGCTMDVGLFPGPETFLCSTLITATQCAKFAALGVNFEVTVYPVHSLDAEP